MDELLMAPTITGPTTLRPLLPRYNLYRYLKLLSLVKLLIRINFNIVIITS